MKTPAWKDVCGTPNGVISGFHLTRGLKSLRSTADPRAFPALQLGTNCADASCSCSICPQAKTAISKCMLRSLPELRWQYQRRKRAAPGHSPSAAGYCCSYSGSEPPSDLVPDRCMLQRMPGYVVRSFPQTIAVKPPLLKCDPCAFLWCTYGLGAQRHPGLQHPR